MAAAIFSADLIVQLRVAVAAAAQDTAEGAVVTAAGVAAEILSEAAGAVRNITGELRDGSSEIFSEIGVCSCV